MLKFVYLLIHSRSSNGWNKTKKHNIIHVSKNKYKYLQKAGMTNGKRVTEGHLTQRISWKFGCSCLTALNNTDTWNILTRQTFSLSVTSTLVEKLNTKKNCFDKMCFKSMFAQSNYTTIALVRNIIPSM